MWDDRESLLKNIVFTISSSQMKTFNKESNGNSVPS